MRRKVHGPGRFGGGSLSDVMGGPMGDDTASRTGWGVVLGGHEFDLDYWREAFKQPFDPLDLWVMETKFGPILRSSLLDSKARANAAYESAEALMAEANGALGVSHRARVVQLEAIAEVFSDGACQLHMPPARIASELRIKSSFIATLLRADGTPYPEPPPEPSSPQLWLRIAAEDDLLADALTYFARGDDWFTSTRRWSALRCGSGARRSFAASVGRQGQDQAAQADRKLRTTCKREF